MGGTAFRQGKEVSPRKPEKVEGGSTASNALASPREKRKGEKGKHHKKRKGLEL